MKYALLSLALVAGIIVSNASATDCHQQFVRAQVAVPYVAVPVLAQHQNFYAAPVVVQEVQKVQKVRVQAQRVGILERLRNIVSRRNVAVEKVQVKQIQRIQGDY